MRIQFDNESEFISKEVERWAYENSVTVDFSRPSTLTDSPHCESFSGKFRDECQPMNGLWIWMMHAIKSKNFAANDTLCKLLLISTICHQKSLYIHIQWTPSFVVKNGTNKGRDYNTYSLDRFLYFNASKSKNHPIGLRALCRACAQF